MLFVLCWLQLSAVLDKPIAIASTDQMWLDSLYTQSDTGNRLTASRSTGSTLV
jgi:hypothetical protein